MNDDGFFPGVALASICWIVFILWIQSNTDNSWRYQIQDHGCGGYYLDANSIRQWDWKSNPNEKQPK